MLSFRDRIHTKILYCDYGTLLKKMEACLLFIVAHKIDILLRIKCEGILVIKIHNDIEYLFE